MLYTTTNLNMNSSIIISYLKDEFKIPLTLSGNVVLRLSDNEDIRFENTYYNYSFSIFSIPQKNKSFILNNIPILKNTNPDDHVNSSQNSYANHLNNPNDFWNISISDIVSLFLGIVAFIAALPTIIGFFISHIYKSKIEIFFPPKFHYEKDAKVKWNGLENPNVRNNKNKVFQVELEIISLQPWQINPRMQNMFPHGGLRKEVQGKGGFWRKTNRFELSSQMSFIFPLIPVQQHNIIRIIIYPRIKLSEFGFPSFYGEISLRSIEFTFIIEP